MADNPFTGTLSVTGNVGIGAEPLANAPLYVRSSTDQNQVLIENSAGILLKLAINASGVSIGTDMGTTVPLSFQTNGASRLSIDNIGSVNMTGALTVENTLTVTGNTTIGTSKTSATLEVKGAVKAASLQSTSATLETLTVNGNIGVGTTSPGDKLEIVTTGNGLTVRETEKHSVSLNLKNTNGFWHISGPRSYETNNNLSIFWNNNAQFFGPHLTVTDNGNVGIGTNTPKAKLDVAGTIKGNGALAGIWAAQPLTAVSISVNNSWQNVANTSVSFKLDRDAAVFFTYSINVQPDGNPGGDLVGTRLLIDNSPYRSSGSHYQPFATADSNVNLNGNQVLFLGAGDHTVLLQWAKFGSTVGSWSNVPDWADGFVGGRTLIVMAFYWPRPIRWIDPINRIPLDVISKIDSSQIT